MRYDTNELFRYMTVKKGDAFNQCETNTLL